MANILIADSYLAVSSLYREVLEEYGHYVFPAASGREALLVALHKTIDIAVVDDKLPDFSADEVFTRLKQIRPHIRGILSVSSIFYAAHDAERWDGLITKSSDYTVLEAEVDRLAGIPPRPSRNRYGAGIQDYNQLSFTALGSETDTSCPEITISGSQRNDTNLKRS